MREGLVPSSSTHLMQLDTDRSTAEVLAARLGEMLDADTHAVAAFEAPGHDGRTVGAESWDATVPWRVEVFFSDPPDEAIIRDLVALSLGGASGRTAARNAIFRAIERKDWVAAAFEGLKPVEAGRFLVHGAHDRAARRPNLIAIEIEAALAFGTGHHGTTHGCLLALDALLKRGRPRRVVDVGTGTGVLAIAAARRLHRPVAAGDIDRVAVETARANAIANGAGLYVRPVVAAGLGHPALAAGASYDLIMANILARPLRRMAPSLAQAASADALLILSGLLGPDVPGVLASYRAVGFHLMNRRDRDGWATLVLRRGGASPRRRD
jgi:ribosomal protein L11 methyltransferase